MNTSQQRYVPNDRVPTEHMLVHGRPACRNLSLALACLMLAFGCEQSDSRPNREQPTGRVVTTPASSTADREDSGQRRPEAERCEPAVIDGENSESFELTTENTKRYPNEECQASIVQILAHRNRYHDKQVQIMGYLRVQFEGTAIYLSKEDADYGITRNGFWIDLSKDAVKYDRKYVLVEGTFDKNSLGHMSLWQGTITRITRIVELNKND